MSASPAKKAASGLKHPVGAPRATRRRGGRDLPYFSIVVLTVLVLLGLLAPVLAPFDPAYQVLSLRLTGPTGSNPLGTDQLGRDVLSRILYGLRTTMTIGVIGIGIGAAVGTALGILSGYRGGLTDTLVARAVDLMLSFPSIFFGLLFAVSFGAGRGTVTVAIAVVIWARFARVIRGAVVSIKEKDFISLARVMGCSHLRVMTRYVFPNIIGTLFALISINLGFVIILEATLSFLGAGIPPPTPSLGSMIADGRSHVDRAWWISLTPGFVIFVLVLSLNSLGNWMRRAMEPGFASSRGKLDEPPAT